HNVFASNVANIASTVGAILAGNAGTNLTAATANLVAGTAIGTSANPLHTAVGTLNARAREGGVFISQIGTITIGAITATEQVELVDTTGDIRLGTVTSEYYVNLTATVGSILNVTPGVTNITADCNSRSTLTAAGVIGTWASPITVNIVPGELAVWAGGAIDGVSVNIQGKVLPSNSLIVLNSPPGVVLFNNRIQGGGIPGFTAQDVQRADPSLTFRPYGLYVMGPFDLVWCDQLEPDCDIIRIREVVD
ncbi:MAG: hypothetical protein HY815_29740, partial [Candidatus Riflebacteria bacterium]|nr:hypothetical protein [Candidatus Riflebacteria bacterium]